MSIRQSINNLLGGGQGGTVLGPGYTDKMNYIDKFIENEKYDIEKGGKQYEDDPEGLVWDAYRNRLVREGAPTGLKGNILGMIDWMNANPLAAKLLTGGKLPLSSRPTDLDQAGGYADPYGKGPDPGTLGGQRVEIKPKVKNPHYNAAKARAFQLQQAGAVPGVDRVGGWVNQFAQDAYTGWRDQRRMAANYGMVGNVLKDANLFGYNLDKAAMYDYMNSPRGQAETALKLQQGMAVPRFAKAALIEAIAKRQDAANTFGELGLKRTYFTG